MVVVVVFEAVSAVVVMVGELIFGIAIHPCIENGLINEWNDAGLFPFFSASTIHFRLFVCRGK